MKHAVAAAILATIILVAATGAHASDCSLSLLSSQVSAPIISGNGDGQFDDSTVTISCAAKPIDGLEGLLQSSFKNPQHHFYLRLTLEILSPDNATVVRQLSTESELLPAGQTPGQQVAQAVSATWDGRDASGNPVPSGTYALRALVRLEREAFDGKAQRSTAPKLLGSLVALLPQTIEQDLVAPHVTVDSPVEGQVIGERGAVLVRGTVDDPMAQVFVDGTPVPTSAGQFSTTLNFTHDGAQAIVVTAQDRVFNQAPPVHRTFLLDSEPPVFSELQPSPDGTWVNTPTVVLSGRVSDLTTVTLTVDDQAVPVLDGAFSFTKTLTAGDNTARLRAVDSALHATEATLLVRLDRVPPEAALRSPTPGRATRLATPLVRLEYSDGASGVATSTFHVELNGQDWTPRFTVGDGAATFQPTTAEALPDALYLVTYGISDRAANAVAHTTSFVVDTVPPTATLSPADGATVASPTPLLEVTYQDSSSGVCPLSYQFALDGADMTSRFEKTSASATWQVPADQALTPGLHVFAVALRDRAQNPIAVQSTFTVSQSSSAPPQLQVYSPTNGSTTNAAQAIVQGMARAATGVPSVVVEVGGQVYPAPLAQERFELAVPLAAGANALTVRAICGGFSTSVALTVYSRPDLDLAEERPDSGHVCGTVLDWNTKQPIQGAEIYEVDEWSEVLSDAEGRFAFPVNGFFLSGTNTVRLMVTKPGHTTVYRTVEVTQGQDQAVAPVYLLPLDSNVTVLGPEGGLATSSDGRIQVNFPPGALWSTKEIVLTLLPAEETLPGELPPASHYTVAVDCQPDGLYLLTPVTLRVRNDREIRAGTVVPVGAYDWYYGSWFAEQSGLVSADGQWLEAQISHFSAYDLNWGVRDPVTPPPALEADVSPKERKYECESGLCPASKVSHRFGTLQEWHPLVGRQVLGAPRSLNLWYDSAYADPFALVDLDVTPTQDASLTQDVMGHVAFADRYVPFKQRATTRRSAVRHLQRAEDRFGRALPTGLYQYSWSVETDSQTWFRETTVFGAAEAAQGDWLLFKGDGTPVPAIKRQTVSGRGFTYVVNHQDSPFGAGWGLGGLPSLTLGPRSQSRLLLDDGAGTLLRFERAFGASVEVGTEDPEALSHYEYGDGAPAASVDLRWCMQYYGFDASGCIYFNSGAQIWKVDAQGILHWWAGQGTSTAEGALGRQTQIVDITGLAVDPQGNVYYSESRGAYVNVVRKIGTDGRVRTVAGIRGRRSEYAGDGGPAVNALLVGPASLAVDGHGNLYIHDCYAYRIRKVNAAGIITTVAGNGQPVDAASRWISNVPALQSSCIAENFGPATDLYADGSGNLYVSLCDWHSTKSRNGRIVKIDAGGMLTVIAGSPTAAEGGEGVPATQTAIAYPGCPQVDGQGQVWFVEGVRGLDREYPSSWAHGRLRMIDGNGMLRSPLPWPTTSEFAGSYFSQARFGPDGQLHFVVGTADSVYLLVAQRGFDLYRSASHPQSTVRRWPDGRIEREFNDGSVERFDGSGHLTERTDPNGNRESCTWSADGLLLSHTDAAGGVTVFGYDGRGKLQSILHPQGVTTKLTVDARGDLVAVEDPDGSLTTYSYDGLHHLVRRADGRGSSDYTYNADGQVTLAAQGNGEAISVVPAASLGLLSHLPADAPLPATSDLAASQANALEHQASFLLDPLGAPVREVDEAGQVTQRQFNAFGQVTRVTWPNGRVTAQTFDAMGNRTSVLETAAGAVSSFTFDPATNQLTSATDPLLRTTLFERDGKGNLRRLVDAAGHATVFERDARGLVTAVTNARGKTTRLFRDALGNVERVEDPLGKVTSFTRDLAGNVLSATNARNAVSRFEFDAMNRTVAAADALGHRTTLGYALGSCGCGNGDEVTSFTDALGHATTLDYDSRGHLLRVTDALGRASTRSYDLGGRLADTVDPEGRTTRYLWDPRGLLSEVIAPDGGRTVFERDAQGDVTARVDPMGRRTEYDRNLMGWVLKTRRVSPDALVETTYLRDSTGKVVSVLDALGRPTTYDFDALDQLQATHDAAGGVTRRGYDQDGNLTSYTNPRGSSWQFAFDAADRLVKETDPLGRETTYVRDDAGNVLSRTDAKGQVTRYTLDLADRLTRVDYADGEWAEVSLDACGNRTRIQGARQGTPPVEFVQEFDELNRVRRITNGLLQRRLEYAYTPAGGRASMAVANLASGETKLTRYGWDAAGRLASISPWVGTPVAFAYNPDGTRQSAVLPNALGLQYGYDGLGRLSSLAYTSAGASLSDFRYTFDLMGNVLTQSDSEGQSSFQYDLLDRLTDAQYPDGTFERFGYDLAGNRLRHEDSGGATDYSYDLGDQLLATTGAKAAAYTWDANGNMLTKVDGAGLTRYVWSARDKLGSVELSDGTSNAYSYYPLSDLRLSRADKAGVVQRFLHDGPDVAEELESSNASIASYVEGLGIDEHLARIAADGTASAYVTDRLGTVRGLADAGGGLVNSYAYKAFGEARSAVEGRANPYRFTGRAFEPDTGEYFFRARYYQPGHGLFSALDPEPIFGSSFFAYARGNPIRYRDPTGRVVPLVVAAAFGFTVDPVALLLAAGLVTSVAVANQQNQQDPDAFEKLKEAVEKAKDVSVEALSQLGQWIVAEEQERRSGERSAACQTREKTPTLTGVEPPPAFGDPNSIYEQQTQKGELQKRVWYDESGNQFLADHYDHWHRNPKTKEYERPHQHSVDRDGYHFNEGKPLAKPGYPATPTVPRPRGPIPRGR